MEALTKQEQINYRKEKEKEKADAKKMAQLREQWEKQGVVK